MPAHTRLEGYMASNAPEFETKVPEIIGSSIKRRMQRVFCVDEKTAIGLDRAHRSCVSPGSGERHGLGCTGTEKWSR